MTPTDRMTLAGLLIECRGKSTCWPSVRSLEGFVGVNEAAIRRSMFKLMKHGLIAKQRTDGKRNIYEIKFSTPRSNRSYDQNDRTIKKIVDPDRIDRTPRSKRSPRCAPDLKQIYTDHNLTTKFKNVDRVGRARRFGSGAPDAQKEDGTPRPADKSCEWYFYRVLHTRGEMEQTAYDVLKNGKWDDPDVRQLLRRCMHDRPRWDWPAELKEKYSVTEAETMPFVRTE